MIKKNYFYNFNIKKDEGNTRIFDIIRRKYFKLTPEEWVRQHAIHFLIQELGVPMGLISVERKLLFNGIQKRFDICAAGKDGKLRLLVECKAPHIPINYETLMQASVYRKSLGVDKIWLTNGVEHRFMILNESSQQFEALERLPLFQEWT